MLIVAADLTEQRAADKALLEAAIRSAELLVKEYTTASDNRKGWPACCSNRDAATEVATIFRKSSAKFSIAHVYVCKLVPEGRCVS